MRYQELLELTGVKRYRDMTKDELVMAIANTRDHPIKYLGNGSYGCALKIGGKVYKLWTIDSAYTDFVNYSLQHQNNSFLPKFDPAGIKQMHAFFLQSPDAPDRINYIKMEELSPLDTLGLYTFNLVLDPNVEIEEWKLHSAESVSLREVLSIFETSIRKKKLQYTPELLRSRIEYVKSLPLGAIAELSPELALFGKTLGEIAQLSSEHTLDLGPMNFMLRGDQLVILDPLYNEQDTQLLIALSKYKRET
jgi:hypothetical protein